MGGDVLNVDDEPGVEMVDVVPVPDAVVVNTTCDSCDVGSVPTLSNDPCFLNVYRRSTGSKQGK